MPPTGVAVLVALLLAGCSSGALAGPGPGALPSFYAPPVGLTSLPPGSLVRHQRVPDEGVDGAAYRVMYTSTDQAGQAVPVTGLVYVPRRRPPAGGYPVVSWAHPTDGMANPCTPSLDASTAVSHPWLDAMLRRGWEVLATDYQGEGTPPGLESYLVGDVEAHDALDIVLAARRLPAAHAGTRVVVWGYSQGGQTALFAWELGTSWGNDGLHLLGVVAGAPPSDLAGLFQTLSPTVNRYLLLMAVEGFHVAYGRLAPLGAVLTAQGSRLLPVLRVGCTDVLAHAIDAYPLQALLRHDPATVPGWRHLLQVNDPVGFAGADRVPLLVVQGAADTLVPPLTTAALAASLCRPGRNVEEWLYPGQTHVTTFAVSAGDVRRWIAARLAGAPATTPGAPPSRRGTVAGTC